MGEVTLTLVKSYKGTPCLLLSQPGTPKQVTFFKQDWFSLKAALPQIQSLLKSPHPETVEVAVDDWRKIIFTCDDGCVVIRVTVEDLFHCTVTNYGVIMPDADWENLISRARGIDMLFSRDEASDEECQPRGIKRKRVENTLQSAVKFRKRRVTYYTCTALQSGVTEYHLDRPTCVEAAEVMKEKYGTVQVDIDRHTLNIYNDMAMLKYLYGWFLVRKIHEIKKRSCTGCRFTEGNQEAHVENGCLMDFGEAIDEYLDKASSEISVTLVSHVYCEFLKLLNVRATSNVCVIAQCAKVYLDMSEELEMFATDDGQFSPTILHILFSRCLDKVEKN